MACPPAVPAVILAAIVVIGLISLPSGVGQRNGEALVDVSLGDHPVIDAANWTLLIDGHVERTVRLNYADLLALANITETVELRCVTGPSATAEWTGPLLSSLLDMAGVKEGAIKVGFFAPDGFSTDLTITDAYGDGVILSHTMNGQPLPIGQGFPAQLVVPGNWGYKWAKWVVHVEVFDDDFKGYWESRGWSDDARITGPTDWRIHAALLFASLAVGTYAMVGGGQLGLGLRNGVSPWHSRSGYVFALSLLAVTTWWALATLSFRGGVFFSVHGRIALGAALLAAGGAITGAMLLWGRERARRWHTVLSLSSYFTALAAAFAGLLLALPIFA